MFREKGHRRSAEQSRDRPVQQATSYYNYATRRTGNAACSAQRMAARMEIESDKSLGLL
ncbi:MULTISPECIES: hypothetical protein [unclassified Rhizobium]|uniref:hypothetical protein n=1 Tax=unclassified Rhizobium TaxID=2613769 RepID=UPI001301744A|nr:MULTISPECIES: hypothetical protein [unclassified Rhizobium]MDM9621873.1 hypothetical protein [Rhizobium sp. S96]